MICADVSPEQPWLHRVTATCMQPAVTPAAQRVAEAGAAATLFTDCGPYMAHSPQLARLESTSSIARAAYLDVSVDLVGVAALERHAGVSQGGAESQPDGGGGVARLGAQRHGRLGTGTGVQLYARGQAGRRGEEPSPPGAEGST